MAENLDLTITELAEVFAPLADVDDFVIVCGGVTSRVNRFEALKALIGRNNFEFLYIRGDEFTDGSIRLLPNPLFPAIDVETKRDGQWELTGLRLSSGNSIRFGHDLDLQAIGGDLQLGSVGQGKKSIATAVQFDDKGTRVPTTPVLGVKTKKVVIQDDFSEELVTTKYGMVLTSPIDAYRFAYHFRTGTVAPTEPVTFRMNRGTSENPFPFYLTHIAAADWTVETEIEVDLPGVVKSPKGFTVFVIWESPTAFSLRGLTINTVFHPFFLVDLQALSFEPLVAIPSGTDRFVVDEDGEMMVDVNGNLMSLEYVVPNITFGQPLATFSL